MQSGAVPCDPEVAVTFTIEHRWADAEVEQVSDTVKIPDARELGEKRPAMRDQ